MNPKIRNYPSGKKRFEEYLKDGRYYREDGPAFIEYYENGNIKEEVYFQNIKGPTYIEYHKNGNIRCEYYYQNKIMHREDGPAVIYHDDNGYICMEEYRINGKLHRIDGPAIIEKDEYDVVHQRYYLNGYLLDEFKTAVLIGSL